VLFPAIRVERPESVEGWYYDGGTRLNTPIKPVLDFGVDRVVISATHAVKQVEHEPWQDPEHAPDVADRVVQLLFATLADPLIQDVRMLGKINLIVGDSEGEEATRRNRESHGKAPYKPVPYILVTPPERDSVGDAAAEVFHTRYQGTQGAAFAQRRAARAARGRSDRAARRASVLLLFREPLRRGADRDGPRRREATLGARR
jgi:NTE family protein